MILSNKEVLALLRIGLEEEIDLEERRLQTTGLKQPLVNREATDRSVTVASSNGHESSDSYTMKLSRPKPLRVTQGRESLTRERKAGDQNRAVVGSIPTAPIPIVCDRGLFLLATLP